MKSRIGQALHRELDNVRVSDELRARILRQARAERGRDRRFRRRGELWKPLVALAATVAVLAGAVGLMLHRNARIPDAQRSAAVSSGAAITPEQGGVNSAAVTVRPMETAISEWDGPAAQDDRGAAIAAGAGSATVEPVEETDEDGGSIARSAPEERIWSGFAPGDWLGEVSVKTTRYVPGIVTVESVAEQQIMTSDDPALLSRDKVTAVGGRAGATASLSSYNIEFAADWQKDWQAGWQYGVAVSCTDVGLRAATKRAEGSAEVFSFVGREGKEQTLNLYLSRDDEALMKQSDAWAEIEMRMRWLSWYYDGSCVYTGEEEYGISCEELEEGLFGITAGGDGRATGICRVEEGESDGMLFVGKMASDDLPEIKTLGLFMTDGRVMILFSSPAGTKLEVNLEGMGTLALRLEADDRPNLKGWVLDAFFDEGIVEFCVDGGERRQYYLDELQQNWRWDVSSGREALAFISLDEAADATQAPLVTPEPTAYPAEASLAATEPTAHATEAPSPYAAPAQEMAASPLGEAGEVALDNGEADAPARAEAYSGGVISEDHIEIDVQAAYGAD